jgi:HemY protein
VKRILFIIVIIALAAIGMILAQGQSYITLTYAQWSVQVQLWLIILALLILIVLYKFLSGICCWLCHLPKRWHHYRNGRRTQHEQHQQQTLQQKIQELNEAEDLQELKNRWHALANNWRHQPECADAFVRRVLHFGGDVAAADVIEWQLKHDWQNNWVNYYGILPQNAEKRLKHVNNWLQQRPHDPLLLLSAGRLAMSAEQWGKAEQFLQLSLAQKTSVAAHLELATVQQQLSKSEMAWRSYQAAAQQERSV